MGRLPPPLPPPFWHIVFKKIKRAPYIAQGLPAFSDSKRMLLVNFVGITRLDTRYFPLLAKHFNEGQFLQPLSTENVHVQWAFYRNLPQAYSLRIICCFLGNFPVLGFRLIELLYWHKSSFLRIKNDYVDIKYWWNLFLNLPNCNYLLQLSNGTRGSHKKFRFSNLQ